MAEIKPGKYIGRARAKSEHYDIAGPRERLPFGLSSNNQPQVALDFDLHDERGGFVGTMTVPMSLAKGALQYTIERLRACGWIGKNILDLHGVDSQDVKIDVFIRKDLQGRERLNAEVVTGGSSMTFKLKNSIAVGRLDAFAAYVMRGIEAMPPSKANAQTGEIEDAPAGGTNDEIPF